VPERLLAYRECSENGTFCLEKLAVSQPVNKFPTFCVPKCSWPCSQQHTPCPHKPTELDGYSRHPPAYSFKIHFNVYFTPSLGLPGGLFPPDFPPKLCMNFALAASCACLHPVAAQRYSRIADSPINTINAEETGTGALRQQLELISLGYVARGSAGGASNCCGHVLSQQREAVPHPLSLSKCGLALRLPSMSRSSEFCPPLSLKKYSLKCPPTHIRKSFALFQIS
jgi:hypothetical protein